MLEDENANALINMNLTEFADETASESPAPGGGSISAYVGALGVSLATMVQELKDKLLKLVDEDTDAFNKIMNAFRLPKGSEEEQQARNQAIQDATRYAIEVPFTVMQTTLESFGIIKAMAETGNPNSVTDAGVGALCARTAIIGAFLNVQINAGDLEDKEFVEAKLKEGNEMVEKAKILEEDILEIVEKKIKG